jgi:hypothetical protein
MVFKILLSHSVGGRPCGNLFPCFTGSLQRTEDHKDRLFGIEKAFILPTPFFFFFFFFFYQLNLFIYSFLSCFISLLSSSRKQWLVVTRFISVVWRVQSPEKKHIYIFLRTQILKLLMKAKDPIKLGLAHCLFIYLFLCKTHASFIGMQ